MKKKRRLIIRISCTIVVLLIISGCTASLRSNEDYLPADQDIKVTVELTENIAESVEFAEKSIILKKGDAVFLEAIVSPAELADKIEWTSDNHHIASVDSGGRIDGEEIGVTVITARVGNEFGKISVTVTESESFDASQKNTTAISANQKYISQNLQKIESGESKLLPYYIKVNRVYNCVTVYTFDETGNYTIPVRAMVCSVGKNNGTIVGKFPIYCKYRWLKLYGDVYGQYATGFSGDFLFHSVPYEYADPSTLKSGEFNLLGQDASLGCVRLAVADSKWIYDNCDYETIVEIYDDSTFDGPLGKPENINIPVGCGFDPTDDVDGNPLTSQMPAITGTDDYYIAVGENVDLKQGVSAMDSCGNDVTERLEIIGKVNNEKVGTYRITYKITDALGKSAVAERYIKVT